MAKPAEWTTLKLIAAVVAGLSVLLLLTPLHTVVASAFSVTDDVADGWFTVSLSALVIVCAVVLYREFASLKITVFLLSAGLFLVFAGTLAQTRLGIWQVIEEWFRGRVVWIHFELFPNLYNSASYSEPLSGWSFPFPGGFLILGLLSINMVCAMSVKIASDLSSSASGLLLRRHAGIYILHVGLLVMFAGEFVTGLYAQEGRMAIQVNEWADYVEDHKQTELAFIDPSAPDRDRHIVVPQLLLERHAVIGGDGEVISHESLPYDLRVEDYMANSEYVDQPNPDRFRGDGKRMSVKEVRPVPGTEMDKVDVPAVFVTLLDKEDGKPVGTWMCTAWPSLVMLRDGGMKPPGSVAQSTEPGMPELTLRYARRYLPYRVYLDEVDHDVYDGTSIPHNFSSDVRVVNKATQAERKSHIWMNNPMRHDEKAFYQHQMDAGDGLTVLMVVNNPGVWLPYISCGIVTLGLCTQFGMSLMSYTRRSVR